MSLLSPPPVRIAMSTYALCHISIYFLCKTKMTDGRFVDFCHALLSCSLLAQIDPLRTLYSRHSRDLGSLVAIQQCTHEIVNNRFDLLLIYVDRQPEHVGAYQTLTTQPHPNLSNHVQTHYPVTDTFWRGRLLLPLNTISPFRRSPLISRRSLATRCGSFSSFCREHSYPHNRPQTHGFNE